MEETVVIIVWTLVVGIGASLIVWWWMGVHLKSKEERARAVVEADSAWEELQAEHTRLLQGGAPAQVDGVAAMVAPSAGDSGSGVT